MSMSITVPQRRAETDAPISPVALVQCARSGHAMAHILNHLGESKVADGPAWIVEFAVNLAPPGSYCAARLAIAAGSNDLHAKLTEVHEHLTFALCDPAGWQKASESERAEITARVMTLLKLALVMTNARGL